jgi:hypothetical protein
MLLFIQKFKSSYICINIIFKFSYSLTPKDLLDSKIYTSVGRGYRFSLSLRVGLGYIDYWGDSFTYRINSLNFFGWYIRFFGYKFTIKVRVCKILFNFCMKINMVWFDKYFPSKYMYFGLEYT